MKKLIALVLVVSLTLAFFPRSVSVRALNEVEETTEEEILVPIGETKTLDSPLNPVSAFVARLFSVNTVTWTSENPEIATVDENGVVTGVHAGIVEISAAENGAVVETYSVEVTLPDGVYSLQRYLSTYVISVDSFSMANGTVPALSETWDDIDDLYKCFQLWCIKRVSAGNYTISPYYYPDVQLQATTTTTVALCKPNNTNSTRGVWNIQYGNSGYMLRNTLRSKVISGDTDGGGISLEIADSSNWCHNWEIIEVTAPQGVLVFDTISGNLIANSFEIGYGNSTKEIELHSSGTLEQLGIDAVHLGSSTEPYIYMVSNTSINYNSSNKVYSANKRGYADFFIDTTVNGQACNIDFTAHVIETVTVINKKDNSFTSTYTQYIDDAIDFLNDVYLDEFGIRYVASADVGYYGSIDNCDENYAGNISCGEAYGCTDNCNIHHKNLKRISDELFAECTDNNQVIILWTNRPTGVYCELSNGAHQTVTFKGLNYWDDNNTKPRPVVQLLNIPGSTNNARRAYMACILAHEIAHTLHLDEVYKGVYPDIDPEEHAEETCIMSSLATLTSNDIQAIYSGVTAGSHGGLCSTCIAKLKNVEISDDVYEHYSNS